MSRQVNLGQIVPNIQIGTTTTSNPGTQASVTNVGTALNPILNFSIPKGDAGAIKMVIVNELPSTGADDTIYLVPNAEPETGNNYDEYVYVNGAWEKLGGIQVEVDLTNYVKNTDYATDNKGGVVKVNDARAISVSVFGTLEAQVKTYSQYDLADNVIFLSKGTLENVITGKGLVSNTNYATSSVGGVIKVGSFGFAVNNNGSIYVNEYSLANYNAANNNLSISKGTLENVLTAKIGDIDSVLDSINNEVI